MCSFIIVWIFLQEFKIPRNKFPVNSSAMKKVEKFIQFRFREMSPAGLSSSMIDQHLSLDLLQSIPFAQFRIIDVFDVPDNRSKIASVITIHSDNRVP